MLLGLAGRFGIDYIAAGETFGTGADNKRNL